MADASFPNPIVVRDTNSNSFNRSVDGGTNVQQRIVVASNTGHIIVADGTIRISLVVAIDVTNISRRSGQFIPRVTRVGPSSTSNSREDTFSKAGLFATWLNNSDSRYCCIASLLSQM